MSASAYLEADRAAVVSVSPVLRHHLYGAECTGDDQETRGSGPAATCGDATTTSGQSPPLPLAA